MKTLYSIGEIWMSADHGLTGLERLAGKRTYHTESFVKPKSTAIQALDEISKKYPTTIVKLKSFHKK